MVSQLYSQVDQENEIMKKHFCGVAGLVQGYYAPVMSSVVYMFEMKSTS